MLAPLLAGLTVVLFDLVSGQGSSAWLTMLLRIFFSTAAVIVLLTSISAISKDSLLRVLRWWCAGIVLSAAVSVAQSLRLINLTGVLDQPTGDRFSGLTSHPNSLAFGIVLALPVSTYLANISTGAWRTIWLVCVAVLGWGLILSGSRAGLIVGIPVLVASVVSWLWSPRRQLLILPILILGGIALYLWLPSALESTRLVQGAADSDLGRRDFNAAALNVFLSSPLIGGGFGQMQGVSVPLMVLSAGGLVLGIAYYTFAFQKLPSLWTFRSFPAARMGIICLLAFIGFSLLNPVWMERSTYWSIFVASLLVSSTRRWQNGLSDGPARN
jgi:hypothetical protein